jgi:hypothetical protein
MTKAGHPEQIEPGRRRLLGLIGGLGCLALGSRWIKAPAPLQSEPARQTLSLREAEFYRPDGPAD